MPFRKGSLSGPLIFSERTPKRLGIQGSPGAFTAQGEPPYILEDGYHT